MYALAVWASDCILEVHLHAHVERSLLPPWIWNQRMQGIEGKHISTYTFQNDCYFHKLTLFWESVQYLGPSIAINSAIWLKVWVLSLRVSDPRTQYPQYPVATISNSDLLQSHRLAVKGLAGTVAQLALLCYGGARQLHSKLTAEVYGLPTHRQCMLTTWCS